jgi:short-subunit dehydrogenase
MKKAIVIGASSGLGRGIAKILAQEGFEVGLAARRLELLLELQKELTVKTTVKQMDLKNPSEAIGRAEALIQEMGGVDLFVINAGVIFNNRKLGWEEEKATIDVNVVGFSAMANVAMHHFLKRGKGHLVGISSVSAIRGERDSPAYSASKAFVSNYMEGLRVIAFKEKVDVCVTDIQPGWIETDMAQGQETFWMAPIEKAAGQIYSAIQNKRAHAYITRRWRLYAWLLKLAPRWLYHRF